MEASDCAASMPESGSKRARAECEEKRREQSDTLIMSIDIAVNSIRKVKAILDEGLPEGLEASDLLSDIATVERVCRILIHYPIFKDL